MSLDLELAAIITRNLLVSMGLERIPNPADVTEYSLLAAAGTIVALPMACSISSGGVG